MTREPRPLRFVLALACALAAAGAPAKADPPRRVVSFNVCADQLVVALADPAQVAGLSPYATDPTLSAVAEEARAYRRIQWHAESVVPLDPDLVLVGPRDRSVTQRLLGALGFRVVGGRFREHDRRGARTNPRGRRAARTSRARRSSLSSRLDAAQARLATVPRPRASTALLVGHSGYTEGPTSLAAGLIAEAGLKPPPGAPAGIGGFVPLESLVMMRPDLLVTHNVIELPYDQGSVYLTHPAVKDLYPPNRRIILPVRYTMCGGPGLVAGLDHLADQLAKLAAEK